LGRHVTEAAVPFITPPGEKYGSFQGDLLTVFSKGDLVGLLEEFQDLFVIYFLNKIHVI